MLRTRTRSGARTRRRRLRALDPAIQTTPATAPTLRMAWPGLARRQRSRRQQTFSATGTRMEMARPTPLAMAMPTGIHNVAAGDQAVRGRLRPRAFIELIDAR